MRRIRPLSRGVNLAELLVVLALIGVVATLGFPVIQNVVHKAKVRSAVRAVTNLLQIARLEAIRRGFPTVVQIDAVNGEMIGFVDLHGATLTDPSDGIFNPVLGQPFRMTDYELPRVHLANIVFENPDGDVGAASIDGFDNPDLLPDLMVIFQSDGSAMATGAFRFADRRSNYFELRVAPAATGKLQLRKWDDTLAVNWDGSYWYAEGEVSRGWTWN